MHRELFSPSLKMSPLGILVPTHCMQSSLPLFLLLWFMSIFGSLRANGVRVSGNFMAQDKSRGAAAHGIRHPPYHPDDPECQLPSSALKGAACHSGCDLCFVEH